MRVAAWFRSTALTVSVALVLPMAAGPASAAPLRATALAVVTAPATVHVGAVVTVAGTAKPARPGASVSLQRFVNHTWKTIAHQKSSSTSTFAFHLKAPKTPVTWVLRVARAAGGGDKAAVSKTQHVRVVKASYAVTAQATVGVVLGTVVVTGKVSPHGTGRVTVQQLVGQAWKPVATGVLGNTGLFSVAVVKPVGTYTLRVFKPFSTTVAEGLSSSLHLTIAAPSPAVATTTLPRAVIGRRYSTTLSGTLGTPPYTWSASGLPTGLTLSSAGVLAGEPLQAGSFALPVTVTDGGGRTGTATLALTVAQTTLLAWGYNASGQLGLGNLTTTFAPTPMVGLNAVTSVAACGAEMLALRVDGTVWAVGDNGVGELGLGPAGDQKLLTPVTGLTSVVAIAAGLEDSYALAADGTVWAAGANTQGQLGNGTLIPSRIFQPVAGLGHAVAIAAGAGAAYALLADGTVWAWGNNAHSQLGQATLPQSLVPIKVPGLSGVTAIASTASSYTSVLALLNDGTLRAWGYNGFGQLGDGTTTDRPTPVQPIGVNQVTSLATNMAAGDSFAVRSDGTVWAWGYNHDGEIGDGTTIDRHQPVQLPGLSGVTAIEPGEANIFAVMADGTLRAWGEGGNGQLGTGTETNQPAPVPVPGLTSVVAAAGGEATGYAVVAG